MAHQGPRGPEAGFFQVGVTQLKALKVGRNGPTPFLPPPHGPLGRGEKNPFWGRSGAPSASRSAPKAPMGNELRKSYQDHNRRPFPSASSTIWRNSVTSVTAL